MIQRIRNAMPALAICTALLLGGPATAEEEDFIDYRQHIMKTLREQVALLGMVVENKAPAQDLKVHARGLQLTADTAKFAFSVDAPGGAARALVWEQWEDFSGRLTALSELARDISQAADKGDVDAVAARLKSMNCKACHDTYREPN